MNVNIEYVMVFKVDRVLEESMEAAMRNFMRAGYKGVTETWNVLQHEVSLLPPTLDKKI